MFKLVKHLGVILGPSNNGFDSKAATFCCLYNENDEDYYYLYYSGSTDVEWSKSSIGVAVSRNGLDFTKKKEPLISLGKQSLTPATFKAEGKYWMVFAYTPQKGGRRLAIAVADDPLGPWETLNNIIKPNKIWEGYDIDVGPSVVKLAKNEFLVYYSNVSNHRLSSILITPYLRRQLGILFIKILGTKKVDVKKWQENPLRYLNGRKGSWNESLFCPGYFTYDMKNYLLPSASTYSVGFPYRQYIGLIKEDSSPLFKNPTMNRVLIDGPKEKTSILPNIKSEIALDTPSPLIKDDELWLYYSAMDRSDKIWKTCLTIYSMKDT